MTRNRLAVGLLTILPLPLAAWQTPPGGQAPAATPQPAASQPARVEFGPSPTALPPAPARGYGVTLPAQPCWPESNCLNRSREVPCDGANPKWPAVPPAGIWCPHLPSPLPALNNIPDGLPAIPEQIPDTPAVAVLQLDEVLQCVNRQFPLLLAIEQEREIAAGQRLAAEGAFDLGLKSRATVLPEGSYPNRRFDLGFEQPTTIYGLSTFAGYRYGTGDFPVYQGGLQTADGGEFRAGLALPLLRGGPIDPQRARLRQAQIAEQAAEPTIQLARIGFLRAAARAYWTWIARAEQVKVARRILEIATARQTLLDERLKRGLGRAIDVVDNRRIVAQRERILFAAEREYQRAALELSLYLRDEEGQPLVPSEARLPQTFLKLEPPAPAVQWLRRDIDLALLLRPELQRFPLLRERAGVDLRLAENQLYPGLNFLMSGAQDVGYGKVGLDRSTWDITLTFEVPLQRREALGRAASARGTLLQLSAQETFARDQIVAEVQNAVSELDRAYARIQQAREEKKEAELVLQQEEARYAAGAIDLFTVNIREQQAADALFAVVDTLADYCRALADYRAALGVDAATAPQ